MPPYERFLAWQRAHRLVLAVYDCTRRWPRDEVFGLVAQSRRAAVSVASSIVEGSAKRGRRELGRYLDIANGSLAEVEYLLRLARDLGYLSASGWEEMELLRADAGRSLWGLYQAVRPKPPT